MNQIIKVMVIDDSLFFREILAQGLSTDPGIKVVSKASDPYAAKEVILDCKPDVIICDIEMPRMDGLDFIKRLLPQYPVPIIVISSMSNKVFDSLTAGAIDFVSKPDGSDVDTVNYFLTSLIQKVKDIANACVILPSNRTHEVRTPLKKESPSIIAIGASTGGTQALTKVIKSLPNGMPGIVIVQHIPAQYSKMLAERLHSETSFTVWEAEHGMVIQNDHIYIAPGGKHMEINKVGESYKIRISETEKVNGHCPSIDVLLYSVARYAGKNAIGIILTGMGNDGAKGLLSMRRIGAYTIGQDEKTSIVYGMPKMAFEIGAVVEQLPLSKIPEALCNRLR